MEVTSKELEWVRNHLKAQRALRDTYLPYGIKLWEPWKEEFYARVNNEYSKLDTSLQQGEKAKAEA